MSFEVVQALLQAGAHPSVHDQQFQMTPLHSVCDVAVDKDPVKRSRIYAVVNLLLRSGADCNALDCADQAPLYYAVRRRNYELVTYLLERGADINTGVSVLNMAITNDDIAMVKLFLRAGSDVEGLVREFSPLWYAVEYGRDEIIPLLLQAGAQPLYDQEGNEAPMQVAQKKGLWDVVKILLNHIVRQDVTHHHIHHAAKQLL
jgi:ankyrin repeat protein